MKIDLFRTGLAALALAALPASAFAHGSMKPQHGGLVHMSGETLIELVTGPKGVDVYLSEEDEPVPAAGSLTPTTGRYGRCPRPTSRSDAPARAPEHG